jgi:hypothetical protein
MLSRLHTVLVYFGLREDRRLEAELHAAPRDGWRAAALAVGFCLGLGLALAALWLVGVEFTWRSALSVCLFLALASGVSVVATRLR